MRSSSPDDYLRAFGDSLHLYSSHGTENISKVLILDDEIMTFMFSLS